MFEIVKSWLQNNCCKCISKWRNNNFLDNICLKYSQSNSVKFFWDNIYLKGKFYRHKTVIFLYNYQWYCITAAEYDSDILPVWDSRRCYLPTLMGGCVSSTHSGRHFCVDIQSLKDVTQARRGWAVDSCPVVSWIILWNKPTNDPQIRETRGPPEWLYFSIV